MHTKVLHMKKISISGKDLNAHHAHKHDLSLKRRGLTKDCNKVEAWIAFMFRVLTRLIATKFTCIFLYWVVLLLLPYPHPCAALGAALGHLGHRLVDGRQLEDPSAWPFNFDLLTLGRCTLFLHLLDSLLVMRAVLLMLVSMVMMMVGGGGGGGGRGCGGIGGPVLVLGLGVRDTFLDKRVLQGLVRG